MRCRTVTIVEGVDGSGKSVLVQELAHRLDAVVVHHGPYPEARNISRLYVESMLPALLGYQNVILDRSWLSEVPYGIAFRGGRDRIGVVSRRMIERIALKTGAVVVRCNPGWGRVSVNYRRRRAEEYLDDESQLRAAFDAFENLATHLPIVEFDYRTRSPQMVFEMIEAVRSPTHVTTWRSAGQWFAPTAVVVIDDPETTDADTLHRSPGVSFAQDDQLQRFTRSIEEAGVPESELLWVHAEDLRGGDVPFLEQKRVIAVGEYAAAKCQSLGLPPTIIHDALFDDRVIDVFRQGEIIR